jgi:hypothetical protein
MVDELLHQKNGYDANNIQYLQVNDQQLQYIRRDDSMQLSHSASNSSINSKIKSLVGIHNNNNNNHAPSCEESKRNVSTSVFFKNGKEFVQNEAFENIGDEDL